jgi:hypothetical protein
MLVAATRDVAARACSKTGVSAHAPVGSIHVYSRTYLLLPIVAFFLYAGMLLVLLPLPERVGAGQVRHSKGFAGATLEKWCAAVTGAATGGMPAAAVTLRVGGGGGCGGDDHDDGHDEGSRMV